MCYRARGRLAALILRVGVALFVLFVARPTLGSERKNQEKIARKACLTGDYAKGVSILADLFVETKDPVYIFNQGRCYEQNRRFEDALAKFEEYTRTPGGKKDKAEAEQHIEQCKANIPAEPPPPAPAPTTIIMQAPRPEPTETSGPAATVVETAPPVPGERRWGLVTTGIVSSVLGVGGLGAGLYFNLKANDAAKQVSTNPGSYEKNRKDESTFRKNAYIAYGVGAGCLVTGVVLIAVGAVRKAPSHTTDVAFAPSFGPGQVGAMLTGGF
jgi:hypothetical protein